MSEAQSIQSMLRTRCCLVVVREGILGINRVKHGEDGAYERNTKDGGFIELTVDCHQLTSVNAFDFLFLFCFLIKHYRERFLDLREFHIF